MTAADCHPACSFAQSHTTARPVDMVHICHQSGCRYSAECCRQVNERGQYRLQSEDGSTAAAALQPGDVAEANGSKSVEPLSDLLSIGQAAVESLKPDAAEADELAQLVTPLVLGGPHFDP